jgi:peptidoglycan/LPS O-acetylase OafA/YrhL
MAVILVLIHHGQVSAVFNKVGWAGVDLFFVLSGFLISGLFYSEYKKQGAINYPRFFVRRGLKIYPAFFVMIFVTFLAREIIKKPISLGPYLREILFVQNYKIGIWQHTWSLGVEEHFYIFLPMLLLAIIWLSKNRENPFKSIPWVFAVVAISCILMRAATIYFTPRDIYSSKMVMNRTHERIDSLFFGVLLGYLHHYYPCTVKAWMSRISVRILVGVVTVASLSCVFIFDEENRFLLIWGLSFLYVGFGGLLMMSLQIRDIVPGRMAGLTGAFGTVCAFIGAYSYSIYLWHIPFQAFAPGVLRRLFDVELGPSTGFWFYFAGSVTFGITMATLIEFPVLALRDRLFPSPQMAQENGVVSQAELVKTPSH